MKSIIMMLVSFAIIGFIISSLTAKPITPMILPSETWMGTKAPEIMVEYGPKDSPATEKYQRSIVARNKRIADMSDSLWWDKEYPDGLMSYKTYVAISRGKLPMQAYIVNKSTLSGLGIVVTELNRAGQCISYKKLYYQEYPLWAYFKEGSKKIFVDKSKAKAYLKTRTDRIAKWDSGMF